MKVKINQLTELRNACVSKMKEILDNADNEKRAVSDADEQEYNRLEKGIDECDAQIKRYQKLIALDNTPVRTIDAPSVIVRPGQDEKEFKALGEFLFTLRSNPNDHRIMELREQSMGVGTEGGIMVPAQFRPELLMVDPQGALFRPRAQVLPAGSPPDAELTIPALDQTSASNMYGGMAMTWLGEGQASTETDANIRDISLKSYGCAGHVVITNKLLSNWQSAGSVITGLMRGAMTYQEDSVFLDGNGVAKPTGFLNHPATIAVARATASQISYADVVGMYARTLMRGGNYAWITSQTTIPQLANIRDTGNNNLWIQSAVAGVPPTLMGIPVLFHERVPGLGSRGDLMLVNFSYYLIKDGSGPFVATSEHVLFTQAKTVFRLSWNVDGKPWLNEPIQIEGSTTNTVSPFVVLAA